MEALLSWEAAHNTSALVAIVSSGIFFVLFYTLNR
jgi:hypothetical protein